MVVTGIFTAIIFGAIIGALGRLIVPGKQSMPIWLTIVVGIAAALIGSWLARGVFGWNFIGVLIVQIVLAAIGVYLVAMFWPRRTAA